MVYFFNIYMKIDEYYLANKNNIYRKTINPIMKNIQDFQSFLEGYRLGRSISPLQKEIIQYMMISNPSFFARIAMATIEPGMYFDMINGKQFKTTTIYDIPDKKDFEFQIGIRKRTSGPDTGYFAAIVRYTNKNDERVKEEIVSKEYWGHKQEENLEQFDTVFDFVYKHYQLAKDK